MDGIPGAAPELGKKQSIGMGESVESGGCSASVLKEDLEVGGKTLLSRKLVPWPSCQLSTTAGV